MSPDEPRDPFAGDPRDPAREMAALDDDTQVQEPLDPADRESLLEDLGDVEAYEALLAPRGIDGLILPCPDCDEPHHLNWALLRSHLRALLDAGRDQVHEPAYGLDASRFVTPEYAQGFLDATLAEGSG